MARAGLCPPDPNIHPTCNQLLSPRFRDFISLDEKTSLARGSKGMTGVGKYGWISQKILIKGGRERG